MPEDNPYSKYKVTVEDKEKENVIPTTFHERRSVAAPMSSEELEYDAALEGYYETLKRYRAGEREFQESLRAGSAPSRWQVLGQLYPEFEAVRITTKVASSLAVNAALTFGEMITKLPSAEPADLLKIFDISKADVTRFLMDSYQIAKEESWTPQERRSFIAAKEAYSQSVKGTGDDISPYEAFSKALEAMDTKVGENTFLPSRKDIEGSFLTREVDAIGAEAAGEWLRKQRMLFNEYMYEPTDFYSLRDEQVWTDPDATMWDKVTKGLRVAEMVSTVDGLKYMMNTAPPAASSVFASIFEGAVIQKGLGLLKLPQKVVNLLTAYGMSHSEGGQIGMDVYHRSQIMLLDEYGGKEWKKFYSEIAEDAYENLPVDVKLRVEEEAKAYIKSRPELYNLVELPSRMAYDATARLNLGTMATNYISVATILRPLSKYTTLGRKSPIAALDDLTSAGTRKTVINPKSFRGILNSTGDIAANIAGESFEEGVINAVAQRYGEELALGNKYDLGDAWNEIYISGRFVEDAIWGGVMGAGSANISQIASSRNRKKEYEDYYKVLEQWENIAKSAKSDVLGQYVQLNNTIHSLNKLDIDIHKAIEEGDEQKAEALQNRKIHVQAMHAFETGTTEQLLHAYHTVATESEDENIRLEANKAIKQVLELESIYNNSKKYRNSNAIFLNRANGILLNNQIAEAIINESQRKTSAETVLVQLAKKFNAEYKFTEDGLEFSGEEAEQLRKVAMKKSAVRQYNNSLNYRKVLDKVAADNNEQYEDISSATYQEQILKVNKFIVSLKKNGKELFTKDTEEEMLSAADAALEEMGISERFKVPIREELIKRYNRSTIAKQKSEKAKAARKVLQKIRVTDSIRMAAAAKIEQMEGENMPGDLSENLTPEEKIQIRNGVKEILDDLDVPTFEGLIEYAVTPEEGDDPALIKQQTRDNFDAFVLGYRENGNKLTDEEKNRVFDKFFGSRKKKFFNLVDSILSKKEVSQEQPQEVEKVVEEEKKVTVFEKQETVRIVTIHGIRTVTFVNTNLLRTNRNTEGDLISQRALDPTRNNPGSKVTVSAATAEEMRKGTGYITIWESGIKRADHVLFSDLIRQKFESLSTHQEQSIPKVTADIKPERVTFTETFNERVDGSLIPVTREGKTYQHRETDGKNIVQHKITDSLIFVNDKDHAYLEDKSIAQVNLKALNFHPDGSSTAEVEIIRESGEVEPVMTLAVYNEYHNYIPMLVKDSDGYNIAYIGSVGLEGFTRADNVKAAEFRKLVMTQGMHETTISEKRIPRTSSGTFLRPNILLNPKEKWNRETNPVLLKPLSEIDPTARIAAHDGISLKAGDIVFDDNGVSSDKKILIINPEKISKSKGQTYELRFCGYNSNGQIMYFSSPINRPEITSEAVETVIWALRAHFSTLDENGLLSKHITKQQRNAIIDFIKLHLKIDIGNPFGIDQFISQFINTNPDDAKSKFLRITPETVNERGVKTEKKVDIDFEKIEEYVSKLPKGRIFFVNLNGTFIYAVGQEKINGRTYIVATHGKKERGGIENATPTGQANIAAIDTIIDHLVHNGLNFPVSNNLKFAWDEKDLVVLKNGVPSIRGTYANYLRETMMTEVDAYQTEDVDGNPSYITTLMVNFELSDDVKIQPPVQRLISVTIDKTTPVASPEAAEETIAEKTKEIIIEESELNVEVKIAAQELGISDLIELFDDLGEDMPAGIDEALMKNFEAVPGVTLKQQHELVNYLFNQIASKLGGEKLTAELLAEETSNMYEKYIVSTREKYDTLIEKLKKFQQQNPEKNNVASVIKLIEERLKVYDDLQDDFVNPQKNEIRKRVIARLLKYSNMNEEDIEEGSEEEDVVYAKEAEERLVKDSMSARLRRFFAGIEEVEDGTVQYGFLGVARYVNFDEAFETVANIIGAAPMSSIDFNDTINILSNYSGSIPWMSRFIDKMKVSTGDMKNGFLYVVKNHKLSMKFMLYQMENNQLIVRVYDTNSSEISTILRREWNSTFIKSALVVHNAKTDQNIIDKEKAKEILATFDKWKTSIPTNKELISWLGEVGIVLSNQTVNQLRENGLRVKGRVLSFKDLFGESSTSSGLFGGIAFKLRQFVGQTGDVVVDDKKTNLPYSDISNTINELAKLEARFSNRIVTSTFRDGDKTFSGLIPLRFASDRIEALKWDEETRQNLQKDPFSRNSMLLSLIASNPDVRDSVWVNQLGNTALKKQGQESNGIPVTQQAPEDQQFTQLIGFWDTTQGQVSTGYTATGSQKNKVRLRMANMFMPTMSDKSQMLMLYMPVLDLDSSTIYSKDGQTVIHPDVQEILFEQLVIPELSRILDQARKRKKGSPSNMMGFDTGSQIFHMIPLLNEIVDAKTGISAVKLMNENPAAYDEKWFIQNFKPQAVNIILSIINSEVNANLRSWRSSGIIEADNTPKNIDSKYLEKKKFDDPAKHAAIDFVINNIIALSNIFQLIAGDIAQYSTDKLYSKFGFDRSIVETHPELEGIATYGEALKTIIGDKSQLRPLAYEPTEKDAYRKLSKKLGNNLGKRLALLLTPGKRIATSKNQSYVQLFLNDVVVAADNIEYLISTFYGTKAITEDVKKLIELRDFSEVGKMFPKIASYIKIESTDGQEYTTLKEHLDILYGQGRLREDTYNILVEKAVSQMNDGINDSNKITREEFDIIFQPIKPVTTGSITDRDGRQRMMYVKSSSFPLIPQLTKGTRLNNIRKVMEQVQLQEGKPVRAAFKSAVKVGASATGIDIFNESLTVEQALVSSVIIPRDNFKIQQDNPAHFLFDEEDEVLMGTQLIKLLFGDGVTNLDLEFNGNPIKGSDLLKIYNDTFGDIVKGIKQDLFRELGLSDNGMPLDEELFIRNLSRILKKEAKARGYAQQDIDALQPVLHKNPDGSISHIFMSPLWSSSNSMRYEALLNSIVTKRLIKLKLPGYSYILGSQTGFDIDNNLDRVDQSRIIYTKFFDGNKLKPRTDTNQAQVFLPSRFRDNNGRIIDLFKQDKSGSYIYIEKNGRGNWILKDGMIADELLKMPSFRIPTSSHVSSSGVEIAGFLPPESGDLMIVPKEFITQKGIDFDIDKEYGYHLWYHSDESERITAIEDMVNLENIEQKTQDAREWYKTVKEQVKRNERIQAEIERIEQELDDTSEEMFNMNELESLMSLELNKTSFDEHDLAEGIKQLKALRILKGRLLKNRIVRIHHSVLMSDNPEMRRKINDTLSMDFERGQAEMLEKEETEFNTILSDAYQRYKMNLGAAGKMGIGVYSNGVTLNSLLQQMEEPVRIFTKEEDDSPPTEFRFSIGEYTFNGKLGRYITIPSDKTIRQLFNIVDEKNIPAEVKSDLKQKIEDGRVTITELETLVRESGKDPVTILKGIRSITQVFAARQNTATDNEKEQIMGRVGINDQTISIDSILSLMGFDNGGEISINPDGTNIPYLLLSQPIVKDYVQEVKKARSAVGREQIDEAEIQARIMQKYAVEEGIMLPVLDAQSLYDSAMGIAKNNALQIRVFSLYLKLGGIAREVGKLQRVIGITGGGPAAGLGKSIFDLNAKYKAITELPYNDTIRGAERIFGEFINIGTLNVDEVAKKFEQGYVLMDEWLIKPDTAVGHMIVNAIKLGYDTWNRFFPYQHDVVQGVMQEIKSLHRSYNDNWEGTKRDIELSRAIIKEMQKMLFSNPAYGIISADPTVERTRLFKEEPGKPSLASYLQGLVNIKHHEIEKNELLKRMTFDIKPAGFLNVSRIIFDNTVQHDFDEEYLYKAFHDLMSEERPLPDNSSFDPSLPDIENPLTFGSESTGLILSGKKKLHILQGPKEGLEVGRTVIQNIKGQRYKITYIGEIMVNDLYREKGGNLHADLGKMQLNPEERKFANGMPKHVCRIEPVYTTRQLAKDLIAYSYLSGGVQGAIEFVKFIPMYYLELAGLIPSMRNIDISNPSSFSSEFGVRGEDGISKMAVQYFQHFPQQAYRVTIEDIGKPKNTSLALLTEFVYEPKDFTPPPILTISSWNKSIFNKDYALFLKGSDGKYHRIHTLGTHGMSEYNFNEYNATSVLSRYTQESMTNNPPVNKPSVDDGAFGMTQEGITAREVLENISRDGTEYERKLASELLKYENKNLDFYIGDIGTHRKGNYIGDYREGIHKLSISNTTPRSLAAMVFLHEYVHSLTVRQLNEYFNKDGTLKDGIEIPQYVINLQKLFLQAKNKIGNQDRINELRRQKENHQLVNVSPEDKLVAYPFITIFEFVAQVMETDSKFREKLAEHEYEGSDLTLMDKFVEFVVDLLGSLGIKVNANLLKLSQIAIMDFIHEENELEEQAPPEPDNIGFTDLTAMDVSKNKPSYAFHIHDMMVGRDTAVLEFFNDALPDTIYRILVTPTNLTLQSAKLGDKIFEPVPSETGRKIVGESIPQFIKNTFGEDVYSKIKSVRENFLKNNPQYPNMPNFNRLPGRSETPTMTYAGVGSRNTPAKVQAQMTELAKELEARGYTLRSGGAVGADQAFEAGISDNENKEIFLASDADALTRQIAKEIHPRPDALVGSMLDLQARNTKQIFGAELDTPVDFVICWTPLTRKGKVPVHANDRSYYGKLDPNNTGGTGQAIALASLKGIPVINMADPKWRKQLDAVLIGKVETEEKMTPKEVGLKNVTIDNQGKSFSFEIVGEKEGKEFLLTFDSRGWHLWDEKKPDGTYTATGYPTPEQVSKLVEKYIPEDIRNIMENWREAETLEDERIFEMDAINELNRIGKFGGTQGYADVSGESNVFKIDQYEITVHPDGKMTFKNGNEVTDETIENKVQIEQQKKAGTLVTTTYNNSTYAVIDDKIISMAPTNYGQEVFKKFAKGNQRDQILSSLKPVEKSQEPVPQEIAINPANPMANGKVLQEEQIEAAAKAKVWLESIEEKKEELKKARALAREQGVRLELTNEEITDKFFFLLSGKAGTGKTFTTEVVLESVGGKTYSAPTHQAKNVLKSNLPAGTKVYTLQSLVGIKPIKSKQPSGANDKKPEFYGMSMEQIRSLYYSKELKLPLFDTDFVVIDECSQLGYQPLEAPQPYKVKISGRMQEIPVHMNPQLGTYLLEMIKLKYELTGRMTTVFMMGDIVQTVPIGTKAFQISGLLESVIKSDNFAKLEKVRRVDDPDILAYQDGIRNAFYDIYNAPDRTAIKPSLKRLVLNGNFQSEHLKQVKGEQGMINKFVELYKQNLEQETPDPNYTVIVNYNNSRHPYTLKITKDIRQALFGEKSSELLNPNESILHSGSYEYKYKNEEYSVENDEKLIVKSYRLGKQTFKTETGKSVELDAIVARIVINNPDHGLIEIDIPYISNYYQLKSDFWQETQSMQERKNPFALAGFTYGEIIDYVEPKINTFEYGYIINNFKVQGSGILNPIVDTVNLFSAGVHEDLLHVTTYMYTALTRVRNTMYVRIDETIPNAPSVQDTEPPKETKTLRDFLDNNPDLTVFLLDDIQNEFSEKTDQLKCNL